MSSLTHTDDRPPSPNQAPSLRQVAAKIGINLLRIAEIKEGGEDIDAALEAARLHAENETLAALYPTLRGAKIKKKGGDPAKPLTVAELADAVGFTPKKTYRWLDDGRFPGVSQPGGPGTEYLIPSDTPARFLAGQPHDRKET